MMEPPENPPPLLATVVTEATYQMKIGWFDPTDTPATLDAMSKILADALDLSEVPALDPFTTSVMSALYVARDCYRADKANQDEE